MTNKNIYLLIISFFVLISSSNGQVMHIGGGIGYNLSKLNYNPENSELDYAYRDGVKFGLFVEYQLSNLFSIHSELNYSMRGGEYMPNFVMQNSGETYTQKLDYLEIPILVQYKFIMDNDLITPKLFIGPEVSYLLSSKNKCENENASAVIDDKDRFVSIEYGIILGLGMDFNLLKNKFTFDARYNFGLNNISKNTDVNIISNTISFNIGYALEIF